MFELFAKNFNFESVKIIGHHLVFVKFAITISLFFVFINQYSKFLGFYTERLLGKTSIQASKTNGKLRESKFTIFVAIFSAIVSVDTRGPEVGDDRVCDVVYPLGHAHGRDAAAAGLTHVTHLPAVIHVILICTLGFQNSVIIVYIILAACCNHIICWLT